MRASWCLISAILGLLSCLAATRFAAADILFLDLNNNPDEIEATKRAAEKLGEKVIVHPTLDEKLRAQVEAVRKEWVKADLGVRSKCAKNQDDPGCSDANAKFDAIDKKYEDVTDKIELTEKGLEKILARHKKEGVHFDKIVISGHQENAHHFGVFADLRFKFLAKAFKKYGTCEDTQAVYPFGCSTVSQKGVMEERWKDVCPNLKLIGAYNGQGPLGYMRANKKYLEGLITKTDEIISAKTNQDAQNVFKSIDYVNDKQVGLKAGICLNSDVIITNAGISSLSDALKNCPAVANEALEKRYVCYRDALPGCEDLPVKTNGGPLRQFYAHLNDTHACNDTLEAMGHVRPPSESVLRLIFDKNVRANFETLHKPQLEKLNRLLKTLRIPDQNRLEDLGHLTRKQYVDKLHGLKKAYQRLFNKAKDRRDDVEDPGVAELGFYMDELEKLDDPKCVPSRWIDPSGRGESSCGIKSRMDSAERRAQLYTERVYKRHLREEGR